MVPERGHPLPNSQGKRHCSMLPPFTGDMKVRSRSTVLTAAAFVGCLLSPEWRRFSADVWLPPSDRLLLPAELESVVCTFVGRTPRTNAASEVSTCSGMSHCAFISSDTHKKSPKQLIHLGPVRGVWVLAVCPNPQHCPSIEPRLSATSVPHAKAKSLSKQFNPVVLHRAQHLLGCN